MQLEHGEVEARGLAERYFKGQLGEDEQQAFEEHYLHCRACTEQLEVDTALQQALRTAAAQDALRAGLRPLAVLAWLVRSSRTRQMAVVAGSLATAAILPALWQQQRIERLSAAPPSAAAPSADSGATSGLRAELEAQRREAAAERARLEGSLAREQQASAELSRELQRAQAPQANTPILSLGVLRGGGGEPDTQVAAPRSGWVVLALELSEPAAGRYGLELARAATPARTLWEHRALEANAEGALVVSLPARLLTPGDYVVRARALGGAGTGGAHYSFRVLPAAR